MSIHHAGVAPKRSVRVIQQGMAFLLALTLALAPAAWAERTRLKPGWNMFSPQQDVELGKEVSRDAERQLVLLNDPQVDAYVNALGRRLAARAPGEKYPYQFKVINDRGINAFALPGGYIYINRGVIEAADNEAQLASVIAHEMGHVALRHGTNQASKAYAAQVPLAILGGALGSSSVGAVLAQLGAGFAANSVLLKYSRDAERQADILGVQILYDNGYDPRAGSQFFEKIDAESKKGRPPQWLSSHPNPENRVELISREVNLLGGPARGYKTDSLEFRQIKQHVLSLPAPPKSGGLPRGGKGGGSGRPDLPSGRYADFENRVLRIRYPDNWRYNGQGSAVTFVPDRGIVDNGRGNAALAYGVIVNLFEPHGDRYGQVSLEEATDQLIEDLRQSNPSMRVTRRYERIRLGSERALSTYLSNASPVGGKEVDWLVTVLRPEGLVFFVCVAPEREYSDYDRAFETMLDSVRFRR